MKGVGCGKVTRVERVRLDASFILFFDHFHINLPVFRNHPISMLTQNQSLDPSLTIALFGNEAFLSTVNGPVFFRNSISSCVVATSRPDSPIE